MKNTVLEGLVEAGGGVLNTFGWSRKLRFIPKKAHFFSVRGRKLSGFSVQQPVDLSLNGSSLIE